ncbi:hypothetical protein [uncultured Ruminococcus sp.]|uniref:hypothetical protein n=1 Tax=uncultured Ruminococcus sp. TaxID=165186 RepID=UPI0025F289A6|nr:hypothetical protein [uncultured Ruminococcus sp.]
MFSKFDKTNTMKIFFKMCCKIDLIKLLKGFTHGIGCCINDIALVFSDDPDENAPNQMREYKELENFIGVGFYCDFFPSPLLITYPEFYNCLKTTVDEYIADKDESYKQEATMYLSKIKKRYILMEKNYAND